jgi:thymidylate synthase
VPIPVLTIKGKTLPEVWEKAVIKTWEEGGGISTEYDNPRDPPSKDATVIMVIEEPFAEPRIHRGFPGGLDSLEIYRQEVVDGVHDHWINPEEGKWTYTYHKRLFEYEIESRVVNQIDYIINKLADSSYSRRAQAITWNPKTDPPTDDPPCLQRIWFRIVVSSLVMNAHWRSRDGYKAAMMNIFALTDLQRIIAEEISEKTGQEIKIGRYVDISDSFHIYGSYYKEFEGFLNTVKTRSFEERTWNSKFAEPFFEEGRKILEKEKNSPKS